MPRTDLEQAVQKAYDEGYIDDPDDPWADLDCFGEHDTANNNCGECPLEEHCLDTLKERQAHEPL